MKKRILLFTAIAGFGYVILSSSNIGGAAGQGADGTKASGAANTCGRAGCHNANTSTTVTIELDSNGTVPATHYVAGKSYTIKITGTNTGSTSLPRFGFQLAVVKLAGAGTSTAAMAGSYGTTLPASVHKTLTTTSFLPFDVIEHDAPIVATSGTGGSGTTYVESIPWTAPASGTGTVIIYACVNAVNFDGATTGDAYNSAKPDTINEKNPLTVSSVTANMEIVACPNPASNNVNLLVENAPAGNYSIQVYSLGGKLVAAQQAMVSGASQAISINSSNWAAGTYMVSVEKDGSRKVIAVVKQ